MATVTQTAIYVKIALRGTSGLVLDAIKATENGNSTYKLFVKTADASSKSQVWQLLPNFAVGGSAGGYSLCNYSFQTCAYNPDVEDVQVYLNDDPTPYGSGNYCWTVITQNYDHGIVTLRDFVQSMCMTAQGESPKDGNQVLIHEYPKGGPGGNQLWSLQLLDTLPS